MAVQLFRALANYRRIALLRLLAVLDERSVNSIADSLGIAPSPTTVHLKQLSASGIIWRRRQGCYVFYRLADAPTNPLARVAIAVLRDAFSHVPRGDVRHVVENAQLDEPHRSDQALFACFTAFTHPRRLQIIQSLSDGSSATPGQLALDIGMAPQSARLHASKLIRRGILTRVKTDLGRICQLARPTDAVRGPLLHAVVERLARPH